MGEGVPEDVSVIRGRLVRQCSLTRINVIGALRCWFDGSDSSKSGLLGCCLVTSRRRLRLSAG